MTTPIVIIPARNEAETIATIVKKVKKYVPFVVVVNDCSVDETRKEAEKFGASVINLKRRCGYSAAILAGFEYALTNKFSVLVTLDADGAHDPEEIPEMISAHLLKKADLTIGNRFQNKDQERVPSPKWWVNYFGAQLTNFVFDSNFKDVTCGFRAFSHRNVKAILGHGRMPGFSLIFRSLELAIKSDYVIRVVPISVKYDAVDLMCTSQAELLDFLNVVSEFSKKKPSLKRAVELLKKEIVSMMPVTLIIGREVLYAHPLRDRQAYIFQRQLPVFYDRAFGSKINFNFASSDMENE